MANKLFGTDGIRGIANTYPMTAETAFRLGRVLGLTMCHATRRAAVAKDTRISGDMLEAALIAGLTSSGTDVVRLGVVPTPLLTFATDGLNVGAAVMITASHNPYRDNGLKVINAHGDKLSDDESAQIEHLLLSEALPENEDDRIGSVKTDLSPIQKYLQNALRLTAFPDALQGLRVVLDCANGSFSEILPKVFKSLSAGVITLSAEPDGYNINQDCGSQHTEKLQQTVVDSHAHLGIAVDGDGDRIIICDEKGTRIDGDQIIAFLATYLKNQNKLKNNAAVATIWSNLGLEKYLKSIGVKLHRTPVGERYVIEKMKETGSNLGGEESGHMVLSDYAKTGDAMLVGLVIALGLTESKRKMSDIFPIFEKCPCIISQVRFSSADKAAEAMVSKALAEARAKAEEQIKPLGSVIVRKSGTEPVVKIRVEGEDEQLVQRISQTLTAKIEKLK
jgi:phosphoglucosamine mutase